MHLTIVTTNPIIAEVLAEELRDVRPTTVDVVDIYSVEAKGFEPAVDDVVIVTEAAVDRWCRCGSKRSSTPGVLHVIGALGSRWLDYDSPESQGFDGFIDFKWPTRDLVRELESMRTRPSASRTVNEPCPPTRSSDSMCHDDIDRRIAAYITMGMSDRDIGAKVFLSSQTVRNRVSRMLERSHAHNRTQLAMMCVVDPEMLQVHGNDEVSTPRKESIVR